MGATFKRLRGLSTDLDRVQDNVGAVIDSLSWQVDANPLAKAKMLLGVPLVTGVNYVPHGLGRAARGFLVVAQTDGAASSIYGLPEVSRPDVHLKITSSATVTVNMLVF